MLHQNGIKYSLIGHSERRLYFKESDDLIVKKLEKALNNNIFPIICIGESKEEQQSGMTINVLKTQLHKIKPILNNKTYVTIAYEPIWAIGTGLIPKPCEIQLVHKFIKEYLCPFNVRTIYGGSVNSENCLMLMNEPDIDGFLIGSASLKDDFINIINICSK